MDDLLARADVVIRKAKVGDQADWRVIQALRDEVVRLQKVTRDSPRRPLREEQA